MNPQLFSPQAPRQRLGLSRRQLMSGVIILLIGIILSGARGLQAAQAPVQVDAVNPVPIFAYYYIWFDEQSWDRAKTDYPALGRYSSDDREIMTQHVRWAKEAGIDGFIVSWKSTFLLDRRLERLLDIAAAEDFQIWTIYQGLDFDRQPLSVGQIDADFDYFVEHYGNHPAFAAYERPVMIWSGTWEFTPQQIDTITGAYRSNLQVLASEKNVEGFMRLAGLVDGNAYYWSSANPYSDSGIQQKLDAMGQAVHEQGGLWVAPAAPGFDARLVGGTRVVDRQGGQTLRQLMDAAQKSSPDAIGLISWNEFSENTHIEPSQNHGTESLEVLADLQAGVAPQIRDFDSNAPATTQSGAIYPFLVLGGLVCVIAVSIGFTFWNNSRSQLDDSSALVK